MSYQFLDFFLFFFFKNKKKVKVTFKNYPWFFPLVK